MLSPAIAYKISQPNNAMLVWALGAIGLEHGLRFLQAMLEDSDFSFGMNCYYDLTACTDIDGELSYATEISDLVNGETAPVLPARTAFILPEENEKVQRVIQGLVLMFSASPVEHACYSEEQREVAYSFIGFDTALRDETERLTKLVLSQDRSAAAEHGIRWFS
ncbi:hypothetical protein [Alteromonas facilis]|uniref:hypothetical protein n=1 Tax=Alteromonas facilis TaxID=2048004 RepID=UPI000F5CB501|nr:hypothetical protein [Alteromonas facilis]